MPGSLNLRIAGWSALLLLIALIGMPSIALADPVGECKATTSNQAAADQCLKNTLAAAQQVLDQALSQAQTQADSLDQSAGNVEARPLLDQAETEWENFREADCQVSAAFASGPGATQDSVSPSTRRAVRFR